MTHHRSSQAVWTGARTHNKDQEHNLLDGLHRENICWEEPWIWKRAPRQGSRIHQRGRFSPRCSGQTNWSTDHWGDQTCHVWVGEFHVERTQDSYQQKSDKQGRTWDARETQGTVGGESDNHDHILYPYFFQRKDEIHWVLAWLFLQVYSYQFKTSETPFGRDQMCLSGKIGGMRDDIAICCQLVAYWSGLEVVPQ